MKICSICGASSFDTNTKCENCGNSLVKIRPNAISGAQNKARTNGVSDACRAAKIFMLISAILA